MNTFATLLLAFPFYLAIKGKLTGYVALAKPDASSGAATSQNTSTGAPSSSASSNSASSTSSISTTPNLASTVQNVAHIFGDVAAMASV